MERNYSLKQFSTLRDYVCVLFRQKHILFTSFFVFILSVFIGVQFKTPVYQARVKMLISGQKQTSAPYYVGLGVFHDTEIGLTQSKMVTSMTVLDYTVRALRLDRIPFDYEAKFASPLKTYFINRNKREFEDSLKSLSFSSKQGVLYRRAIEGLRNRITVEPVRGTRIFVIEVQGYNPVMVATIANVLSRAYVIFDLQQISKELELKYGEKHPTMQQIRDNIQLMEYNLTGIPLDSLESFGPGSVKIIEQAFPPIKPKGVQRKTYLVLALFMSIFLGLILAFLFEYFDETIKNTRVLEEYVGVPVLGTIPQIRKKQAVLIHDNPKDKHLAPYINAYNILSDQIRFLICKNNIKTLLICSVKIHEGATTVLANLAYFLSGHEQMKVLLIDCNYQGDSSLENILHYNKSPGLSDILTNNFNPKNVIQEINPRFSVIPQGETHFHPLSILDSDLMDSLLKDLRSEYDIILIDCPDLSHFRDGFVIASKVEGVVLVVSERKTRKYVIDNIISPFKYENYNLMGAILNNKKDYIPKFLYELI